MKIKEKLQALFLFSLEVMMSMYKDLPSAKP